MDISHVRFLRWIGVVVPAFFIAVLTYIAHFYLPQLFSREMVFVLTVIVSVLGVFVFATFVFSQIERRERNILQRNLELAALSAVSEVVSGSLELEQILTRALDKVLEVINVEIAEAFLLNETTNQLELSVQRGSCVEVFQPTSIFRLGEGLPGKVAASGQALLVDDLIDDPRFLAQPTKSSAFQTYACVPLRVKDRVVGVIDIARRHIQLTSHDLHLLGIIANQVGLAVENARLYAHVQQTAEYLNALIESSGDAMITTDPSGHIRSWNRGAEEIYGWTREEAVGKLLPMVPASGREEAQTMLKQLLSGETIRNRDVIRQRCNGDLIEVLVTVSPLCNALGQTIGIVGISKDISELKRLQRTLVMQQQSLAVLEERERICMDLHDGAIQSLYSVGLRLDSCAALLTTSPDEVTRRLERAVEDITTIIKQIRNYIFDLRSRDLYGRHLIEGLNDLAQELSVHTMIQVDVIADTSAAEVIKQLSQAQAADIFLVVREALTNILKHAHASTVAIRLWLEGGKLYLSVKDDGIGFSFETVKSANGQGLHNLSGRAKQLGADLSVTSCSESGTEIKLEMPLAQEVYHG